MYDAYVFTSRIERTKNSLYFQFESIKSESHPHAHARASTFVWHTHSHSIYIKCNWICSSPIVCLLWMPSMTIYQYLALKSLFLTDDDDRMENVRTMNHKSTCNAHHHRLYEVLCISQLCDDFPISGHFLFRFFPSVSFDLLQSTFHIMVTDFSPLNTRGFSLIKLIAFDIHVSTHSWLSIEKSKNLNHLNWFLRNAILSEIEWNTSNGYTIGICYDKHWYFLSIFIALGSMHVNSNSDDDKPISYQPYFAI